MHVLVALFLEVITLAIILVFVRLAALQVLVITVARTIMALIVLVTMVRLAIIAIASVALMVVSIFCGNNAAGSSIHGYVRQEDELFSSLLAAFVLGDLFENASRLVGCLTMLKESNKLERVSRHCLVQVHELQLMRLGLHMKKICLLFSCAVGTSII
jgi:hypothetical protein